MLGVTRTRLRRTGWEDLRVPVNGQPGHVLIAPDGSVFYVLTIDVADGAIQTVRIMRNPEKLRHVHLRESLFDAVEKAPIVAASGTSSSLRSVPFDGPGRRHHSGGVRVRHVLADEHAALRELRLASLASDPEAFGSTYARDAARPPEFWTGWSARSEEGTTERTFVLTNDEDSWLGLVIVRLEESTSSAAELLAMWVAPEARGRGAAQSLCDACAAWAKERGCEELTLSVAVDNEGAQRAYTKAGFAVRGQTTSSHGERTLDVLVMSRTL